MRQHTGNDNPAADAIQIMTMKVSKGLEFAVVIMPGVRYVTATHSNNSQAKPYGYLRPLPSSCSL